jgi:hypothetical protein
MVCPGNYLLPFLWRNLKSHIWVLVEQRDNVEPGDSNCLY